MSNRWERGQSPPYKKLRSTTGGTVVAGSTGLVNTAIGSQQLSVAGQVFGYMNKVFGAGDGEAAVSGFVTASGQDISRTDFPILFNRLGVTWGVGDGVNTFNVPRVDGGTHFRAVDAPAVPRPVGTVASGNFTSHNHTIRYLNTNRTQASPNPNSGAPTGVDNNGPATITSLTNVSTVNIPGSVSPTGAGDTNRPRMRTIRSALAVKDSIELPIGSICGFIGPSTGWDNESGAWLLCDGSSYDKTEYIDLFLTLGTTFGSTATTFNVPDLRGFFMAMANQYAGQYENQTVNSNGFGSELGATIINHSHTLSAPLAAFQYGTRVNSQPNSPTNRENDPSNGVDPFGPTPGTQTVPANASCLWIIKAV